jgi:hypothetical protein
VTTIACIVEGDGEVRALPVLLRRLAESRGIFDIRIPAPIRVHRDQFMRRDEEFRRKLLLAAAKADGGTVLILLDADDDCPVTLAAGLNRRALEVLGEVIVAVVVPQREYEAWFLAAAGSLAGKRGLQEDLVAPMNSDAVRNAKGWLSERMSNGRYHEVSDQPAMSAVLDIDEALAASRSFRKFVKECDAAFDVNA